MKKLSIVLGVSITFFVIVACIIGYYKVDANNKKLSSHDLEFGVPVKLSDSEAIVSDVEKFIIERLTKARQEFEPWALSNKVQINELRSSKNPVILLKTYNILPEKSIECGISTINMNQYPKYNRKIPGFGWHVPPKKYNTENKLPVDIDKTLKEDFENKKDIRIMSAACAGHLQAQLWLSGRISITNNSPKVVNGAFEMVETAEREIAPPYQFIAPVSYRKD
jgi:hypothetical protein